mmetsp:Transcript_25516/g.55916  ORF Transcript_25516/g.55916 Transcript_25516/m.55916 type:complete len:212 (+) Transcript_25516:906-1541(+)
MLQRQKLSSQWMSQCVTLPHSWPMPWGHVWISCCFQPPMQGLCTKPAHLPACQDRPAAHRKLPLASPAETLLHLTSTLIVAHSHRQIDLWPEATDRLFSSSGDSISPQPPSIPHSPIDEATLAQYLHHSLSEHAASQWLWASVLSSTQGWQPVGKAARQYGLGHPWSCLWTVCCSPSLLHRFGRSFVFQCQWNILWRHWLLDARHLHFVCC